MNFIINKIVAIIFNKVIKCVFCELIDTFTRILIKILLLQMRNISGMQEN